LEGPLSGVPETIVWIKLSLLIHVTLEPTDTVIFDALNGFWLEESEAPGLMATIKFFFILLGTLGFFGRKAKAVLLFITDETDDRMRSEITIVNK